MTAAPGAPAGETASEPARRRDLVAVGASAGGVEALKSLVSELPADLPATVLVALHLSASARGCLADILARSCAMPVRQAHAGLAVVPGEVVVAHPDAHLLVVDDRIVLGSGPATTARARPTTRCCVRDPARGRSWPARCRPRRWRRWSPTNPSSSGARRAPPARRP